MRTIDDAVDQMTQDLHDACYTEERPEPAINWDDVAQEQCND